MALTKSISVTTQIHLTLTDEDVRGVLMKYAESLVSAHLPSGLTSKPRLELEPERGDVYNLGVTITATINEVEIQEE